MIESILLGIVQGITEFLPVSSSGHIVVLYRLLNFSPAGGEVFFGVMLHVGTLFAVLVAMRKEIWQMLKSPFSKKTWLLVVATIPAGVAGVFLGEIFKSAFSLECVGVGFFSTAVLLLATKYLSKVHSKEKMDFSSALAMGGMQVLALFPGVSRSGSTIFGGVSLGVEREEVAKFSFLMSVPIIIASACLEISTNWQKIALCKEVVSQSLAGGISAFLFGMLGIKIFIKIISKGKLEWLAVYLILLGIVVA